MYMPRIGEKSVHQSISTGLMYFPNPSKPKRVVFLTTRNTLPVVKKKKNPIEKLSVQ